MLKSRQIWSLSSTCSPGFLYVHSPASLFPCSPPQPISSHTSPDRHSCSVASSLCPCTLYLQSGTCKPICWYGRASLFSKHLWTLPIFLSLGALKAGWDWPYVKCHHAEGKEQELGWDWTGLSFLLCWTCPVWDGLSGCGDTHKTPAERCYIGVLSRKQESRLYVTASHCGEDCLVCLCTKQQFSSVLQSMVRL